MQAIAEMIFLTGRRRALSLTLCLASAILCGATATADAEADPAATRIRSFYAVLLDTMKAAQRTPVHARYEKLEPAVRATFDLPAMTRIAVGPAWTSIPGDEQKALQEQFARLTIATYANRFDGYSGERFEVEPATEIRGENRIVRSALLKSHGGSVALNYLVHPVGGDWKAVDVYLNGTISELATRRSEFGALLRAGGAHALIDSLRERADKLLQPG